MTRDNHVQLLERASGKSKRELEQLVAAIAPKADVPSYMRKLPEPVAHSAHANAGKRAQALPPPALGLVAPLAMRAASGAIAPSSADRASDASARERDAATAGAFAVERSRAPFALQSPRPVTSITSLSPGRYKVAFTASQAFHDKLEQLRALLRHQVPDGDLALILERAADMLLAKTLKQRCAKVQTGKRPGANKPRGRRRKGHSRSRYIPRAVVREVHARDGGRCTFVSSDGKRCSERGFLELHHHDTPFARGGSATVDNLRLVCRVHNALFAERDFGASFVRAMAQRARLQRQYAADAHQAQLGPDPRYKLDPSLSRAESSDGR
ncbi:MAG: HNH endonuclease [Polyangiales bacterium]